MMEVLEEHFTLEEVKETLAQMHLLKASRTNGTLALFYKSFWELIRNDVTHKVLEIPNDGEDPA